MSMKVTGLGPGPLNNRTPFGDGRKRRDQARHEEKPDALQPSRESSVLLEQRRAEIAAINQSVLEAETAIDMVQVALSGLSECREWTSSLKRTVKQSMAGEIGEEEAEEKLRVALGRLEKVAATTRFGRQLLLDGSMGCQGAASGEGLRFIGASPKTRSSPAKGYHVMVNQAATRAFYLASIPLNDSLLAKRPLLEIEEEGKVARLLAGPEGPFAQVVKALEEQVQKHHLMVRVGGTEDGRLWVAHRHYGSQHGFILSGSMPGLFANLDGSPRQARGKDAEGTIQDWPALGQGQWLMGQSGTPLEGLVVQHSLPPEAAPHFIDGPPPQPLEGYSGRVFVTQNGLFIRLGPQEADQIAIQLPSVHPERLGLDAGTEHGAASLADVDLHSPQSRQDAWLVVQRTEEALLTHQQQLKRLLEANLVEILYHQRVKLANLIAAYPDMTQGYAKDMAGYLQWQIASQGSMALAAQSQPLPGPLLRLLNNPPLEKP